MESDMITADAVEATEFPQLATKYQVSGVPKTMANGHAAAHGMMPEHAFLQAVLAVAYPKHI
ncbi:MAG: thioredoxin family protein [Acidobacteriota bacterium]|nr:MAG: thioredoxin family protein [Acidobacteriota bacterium]